MVPDNIPTLTSIIISLVPLIYYWWINFYKISIKKQDITNITELSHIISTLLLTLYTSGVMMILQPSAPYWGCFTASIANIILFFDYLLNLSRNLPIFYVSNNPHHHSFFERLFSKAPWWGTLFTKLVLWMAGWGVYIWPSYL